MALTISDLHPQHPRISLGRAAGRMVKVTFDASYPTGGESLAAKDLGFSEIIMVLPNARKSGYVAQYDYANSKLAVYEQTDPAAAGGANVALVEVGSGVDLHTLVVDCLIVGA